MEIPNEVKKFRLEKAKELKCVAKLFEKESIPCNEIQQAIKQLEDFNNIPKIEKSDPVNHNYWGYSIKNMIIPFDAIPKKIFPRDTQLLQLQLSMKLVADYEAYKKISDPFKCLEIEIIIKGINQECGEVITGFHIDRHLESENESKELHPAYHFHHGGRQLDFEKNYFGQTLFLNSPRLIHYPMELILCADFIFGNFMPHYRMSLLNDPVYRNILKDYQKTFIKPFIHSIAKHWANYEPGEINWSSSKIFPQLV